MYVLTKSAKKILDGSVGEKLKTKARGFGGLRYEQLGGGEQRKGEKEWLILSSLF